MSQTKFQLEVSEYITLLKEKKQPFEQIFIPDPQGNISLRVTLDAAGLHIQQLNLTLNQAEAIAAFLHKHLIKEG